MTGATCTLAGDPGSVAVARGWVTDFLRANGWGRPLTEIAALVTSELVTNAVTYTDGPVQIELLTGTCRVRISVIDAGTETSAPTVARSCPDPDLPRAARGLYLVDRWAERIGICGDGRGRTVFADICAHSNGPKGADGVAARVAGVLPRHIQGVALAEQRGGFS